MGTEKYPRLMGRQPGEGPPENPRHFRRLRNLAGGMRGLIDDIQNVSIFNKDSDSDKLFGEYRGVLEECREALIRVTREALDEGSSVDDVKNLLWILDFLRREPSLSDSYPAVESWVDWLEDVARGVDLILDESAFAHDEANQARSS